MSENTDSIDMLVIEAFLGIYLILIIAPWYIAYSLLYAIYHHASIKRNWVSMKYVTKAEGNYSFWHILLDLSIF